MTKLEVEQIIAEGKAAAARVGTAAEHLAFNSPEYGGDKLRVALHDAVASDPAPRSR